MPKDFSSVMSKSEYELICDFFFTFSRFESALKSTIKFASMDRGYLNAKWLEFGKENSVILFTQINSELKPKIDYILKDPPKKQILEGGRLIWKPQGNVQGNDGKKLAKYICDIRNNLFHGGKFDGEGRFYEDKRNYKLLRYSIDILNFWLTIDSNLLQHYENQTAMDTL